MKAAAYVVEQDGPAGLITALAGRLGFEPVLPYAGVAAMAQRSAALPLSFVLFAEVRELRSLAGPARAIRLSPDGQLRFSPLIYFCRAASLDSIRACIGMGFDDVIIAALSDAQVAARLLRQVGTPLAYFETVSYFGPDRRRHDGDNDTEPERRSGAAFRHLLIRRDASAGITVLHDSHAAAP